MPVRWRSRFCVVIGFGVCALAAPVAARAECSAARDKATLALALKLVPGHHAWTVKAIDPDLTGTPSTIRALDAFVVRERDGSLRQLVYLNCESALFKAASDGSDLHVKLLAAVIFHESCHLRGMDEKQAGAAERGFLADLIQRGLLPTREGLAHLRQMEQASRPH
jgi:hypothetical protein